jgi:hypothetical protein
MFKCPLSDCIKQYDTFNGLAIHISRAHKTQYHLVTGQGWCSFCSSFRNIRDFYATGSKVRGYGKYCKACHSSNAKTKLDAVKSEVFEHYGSRCNCCKEVGIEFLTVDHIDNDGNKHLNRSGRRYKGNQLYAWLRRNSYPSGFQILCYNCNCAKNFYKVCPHQLKKAEMLINKIEDMQYKLRIGGKEYE